MSVDGRLQDGSMEIDSGNNLETFKTGSGAEEAVEVNDFQKVSMAHGAWGFTGPAGTPLTRGAAAPLPHADGGVPGRSLCRQATRVLSHVILCEKAPPFVFYVLNTRKQPLDTEKNRFLGAHPVLAEGRESSVSASSFVKHSSKKTLPAPGGGGSGVELTERRDLTASQSRPPQVGPADGLVPTFELSHCV